MEETKDTNISEIFSVTIKNLTGQTYKLHIFPSMTLQQLIYVICSLDGHNPALFTECAGIKLIRNGSYIETDNKNLSSTLTSLGIKKDDTIHCILRLRGS